MEANWQLRIASLSHIKDGVNEVGYKHPLSSLLRVSTRLGPLQNLTHCRGLKPITPASKYCKMKAGMRQIEPLATRECGLQG